MDYTIYHTPSSQSSYPLLGSLHLVFRSLIDIYKDLECKIKYHHFIQNFKTSNIKKNLKEKRKKKDDMGVIKHSNLLVTTFLMSLLPFTIESQSHVGIIFPLRKYGNIVSGADVTKV